MQCLIDYVYLTTVGSISLVHNKLCHIYDTQVNRSMFVPSPLVQQIISCQGTCGLGYVTMVVDVEEPRNARMPIVKRS